MLIAGIWIGAGLALIAAILVFRRARRLSEHGDEQQGVGKWLMSFVMMGMISLRLAASLHRGFAVTMPVIIAAVSVMVLITLGVGMRPD